MRDEENNTKHCFVCNKNYIIEEQSFCPNCGVDADVDLPTPRNGICSRCNGGDHALLTICIEFSGYWKCTNHEYSEVVKLRENHHQCHVCGRCPFEEEQKKRFDCGCVKVSIIPEFIQINKDAGKTTRDKRYMKSRLMTSVLKK